MPKKNVYNDDSITSLKGADRVRKRPGVIFGSDGLEGCEHAVFEILSNSIDEAREGHGSLITVTRFLDKSVQVEDMGRGCPVDWNEKEGRYNWELVFCELYAGGKYDNENSENYEFSLGLNGLGSCATQYASQYMDVTVWRGGKEYTLHFEKGENIGGLQVKELTANKKKTGTRIHWLPDLDVFTDIAVPLDYYRDAMKRQAVVNAGVTFRLLNETAAGQFDTEEFLYPRGIQDYIAELAGDDALTEPVFWEAERRGRDRADKPEYKVKLSVALCFSNRVSIVEHYHNSSFLEHGGSPEKATRLALVGAIDKYLRENNKYLKSESQDHLSRRAGLPDSGQQQLLHPDQLREPDEKGHHQQVRAGRHGGVPPQPSGDLFHRESRRRREDRRPGAHQQAQPRDGGKDPHQPEEKAHREDRHCQPRPEVCGLPHQGRGTPRAVHRGGRLRAGRLQAVP